MLRPGTGVRWLILLASPLVLLCPARTIPASRPQHSPTNYYLDAADGDDANSGHSPDQPWKTLAKVNATSFLPGDRILLKAGQAWDGQLWPKGSGSSGQPIQLDSYGEGPKPAIRGDGLVEDAVLLKNQEHWEIADLDISNSGNKSGVRRGVHLLLQDFGEANGILLRRLSIHDVTGLDAVKQNGGIIYTSAGSKKPSRFLDLRIEDNDIARTSRNGISGWSDRWERSKWFPSLRVVVSGNHLRDIGGDGIMISATDGALIEKNLVAEANQRSSGYNVAIWCWSADNTVIQHNEAWGTKGERDGEGFDSDWNSRNTLIQYNYSHDNAGGFVLICDEGNHSASENVGNLGTVVRFNISQNDKNRGVTLSGPVKSAMVYNNTFLVAEDLHSDVVLFTDWYGWPQDTAVLNNIFYVAGQAAIGHAVSRSPVSGHHQSAEGFGQSRATRFAANLYFGSLQPVADPLALSTDPQFEDPSPFSVDRDTLQGLALKPLSPARASGERLSTNVDRDFLGNPVSFCRRPDRGAIQSTSCAQP